MTRILPLAPELTIALFSFAFHFVWEMLQVPAYEGMSVMEHWPGIMVCTQATIGDVGFALAAFWVVAVFRRSRRWILSPSVGDVLLFLAVGMILTIGFEYYYVEIAHRWTYAAWMPLVPPLRYGSESVHAMGPRATSCAVAFKAAAASGAMRRRRPPCHATKVRIIGVTKRRGHETL